MSKVPTTTTRKPTNKSTASTSSTKSSVPAPTRTATPKRKASSNPTSPQSIQKSKIQAMGDAQPVSIAELKQLLSEQTASLTQNLSDQMNSMSAEIKQSLHTQIAETNNRIDSVQANVNNQLAEIQTQLSNCNDKITSTENEIARQAKLNDLRITGINYSSGEDLHLHFNTIAQLIGFDTSVSTHLPSLSRTYARNKTTNKMEPSSTFVAKFIAKHIRHGFYNAYLTKISNNKPITTEMINLPQGGRLLISESLTITNSKLFSVCMSLKKSKKLAQVFTQDGLVCVKANKTSKATTVRSQRDVDIYIAKNEQKDQPTNNPIAYPTPQPSTNQHQLEPIITKAGLQSEPLPQTAPTTYRIKHQLQWKQNESHAKFKQSHKHHLVNCLIKPGN